MKKSTTLSEAYNAIWREEYQELIRIIGCNQASVLTALKLSCDDDTRRQLADFLVPVGYEIVQSEYSTK